MSYRAVRERDRKCAYRRCALHRVPVSPRESFRAVVCHKQLHQRAEQDWRRLHAHVCLVLPGNVHREFFLHQLEKLKRVQLDGRRCLRPSEYGWVQHQLNDLVNNIDSLDRMGQLYPGDPDIDMEVDPSLAPGQPDPHNDSGLDIAEPLEEPLDRRY
uniref:Uncharacterized protein n=1 Tax=Anopheles melas TaxID=34690 RepID=A0A182TNP4_9DIPT